MAKVDFSKLAKHLDRATRFVLWFDEIGMADVSLVGGKNASLGEMYRELTKKGINVPNGFAITAYAYRHFIKESGLEPQIRRLLKGLDVTNIKDLSERGRKIRELIQRAYFSPELKHAIIEAYHKLCKLYKTPNVDVAVRSSATAEDLPEASFAGQQETYLNIRGENELLNACKNCFASLFTNRAIAYREEHGFDHLKVYLSVGVQKMVRSDLACSGVLFTLDTETGFKDVIFITGSWGLGENIVQGIVNPDEYYVHKPTLKEGFKPIIMKVLGEKSQKIIYSEEGTRPTKSVSVPLEERKRFVLSDDEVLTLARWGMAIEEHYSKKKGGWTPMDIEWAKDGILNKLFIVQARPETVQSKRRRDIVEEYYLKEKGEVIVSGKAVGTKVGQGRAHVIKDVKDITAFKPGEVLVTEMTDPDWVPAMRIASAIVTNRGGRTAHAAIVSRELGLPCIVGTNNATEKIKTGQQITVSCCEGEVGKVYKGLLKFGINKIDLKKLPKTKTKIMMNLGDPEEAFDFSFIPNDGIGLAREEFIISNYIKIHPMALLEFDSQPEHIKRKIEEITHGYADKKQFFIDKLSEGIGVIGAAFWPNEVIVRFSDFKSNEYANLIGGEAYEPKEDNPMIGWRGASRYYKGYSEGFGLECRAIKKVRDEFGLKNVSVMIPFCRTVEEGKKVLQEMAKNGLKRGKDGLKVYVMCEIPSNVILAEQFAKIFDGFSIGTNDLTQLILGLDRDSELVSELYDERNEAVMRMVAEVIRKAKKMKKKIGICGDAPSTFPEFARFLVREGIDSISLSPDAVIRTKLHVAEEEKRLKRKR
ncbi:MAG: phosphoenolpyruvate synthase [Candidatus Woesearchaeota archaeon]